MKLRPAAVAPSLSLALAFAAPPPAPAQAPAKPAWVEKSDTHAKVLVDVLARFGPESASQFGVEGLDTAIFDLEPGRQERIQQALRTAVAELESTRGTSSRTKGQQTS